jgi:tetratricopeptide (TPR) repeat protein
MPTFEAETPYWYTMEEGKKFFREGDYGQALRYFEDARNERRRIWTRWETTFISLLSIHDVRRFGDSLDFVETYINDRNQFDAAAALAELVYHLGRGALQNSAQTTLTLFTLMKEYPEAEYWIGEVYRLEGERDIALDQYRKALAPHPEERSPDWKNDILYKIAELGATGQRYNEMERALLEVLKDDTLWQESENFVRNAMAQTLNNEGINQFLTMFRHDNGKTEKAHRLLGHYYYISGRYNLAEAQLMFAALNTNTVVIAEAIRKRFDFTFTTLDDLMREIERRPDIQKYMAGADYFKTLYYLAASLYANGKAAPARDLWTFVSKQRGGEWTLRSQNQLRSPFIEAPVAMP